MRRPYARLAAAALVAAVFALPTGARAVPFVTRQIECRGVAVVGEGEATCQKEFDLSDSRVPSRFETHGNFHARASRGSVVMEWWDDVEIGAPRLVASWDCQARGNFVIVDAPGGFSVQAGPSDIADNDCTRRADSGAAFAEGPQLLVVRATVFQCVGAHPTDGTESKCPFHGYLALERSSVP